MICFALHGGITGRNHSKFKKRFAFLRTDGLTTSQRAKRAGLPHNAGTGAALDFRARGETERMSC
jgi:hypothetical protein